MSICVENLVKAFGAARGVSDVSFLIRPGELVGLIGPNGAGKSTILRILSTFLSSGSGSARVAGFDCQRDALEVRRRLGYLPEGLPQPGPVRVEEFLRFRARLKGLPRAEVGTAVESSLLACDLTAVRRRFVSQLSQGFRRRVGLADALLNDPPVLLLDEPTIGLDPLQVRQTRALLQDLAQTRTVLLSTHLLAEAEQMCSRVLILVEGQLTADVRLSALRAAGESLEECFVRSAFGKGTQPDTQRKAAWRREAA